MRAPDPLRRWLREPKPVARSPTLRPIPGHRTAALQFAAFRLTSPKRGFDPRTQGTRGSVVFSDGAARAPVERLAPISCRGRPRPAPAPESNRASGVVRRTASPASPGVSSKTPAAEPSDGPARSLLPEDAEARCVERERASPTCQRAPGHHVDVRAPGTRRGRVSGALHGASPASAASPGEVSGFSPATCRLRGLWRSGSPSHAVSCDVRCCTVSAPASTRNARERFRESAGFGASSVGGEEPRRPSANRRETQSTPESDPSSPPAPEAHAQVRLATRAAGGGVTAEAVRRPVAPGARARACLRGGPIDPAADTHCRATSGTCGTE